MRLILSVRKQKSTTRQLRRTSWHSPCSYLPDKMLDMTKKQAKTMVPPAVAAARAEKAEARRVEKQVALAASAERLRLLMERAGKIPAMLARETGLAPSTISFFLNGDRLPQGQHLPLLAKSLLTTPGVILGVEPMPATSRAVAQPPSQEQLPEGLADYLSRHERELRPIVADALKKTHIAPESWMKWDDALWAGVAEVLEDQYQRHRKEIERALADGKDSSASASKTSNSA